MQTLYFLIGPTASGKTALSIDWARQNGAEILCADSPLVYKGMDIGTAKPTAEEQRAVAHHGIDLVEVSQRFSVGDYAVYARQVVEKLLGEKKSVLIVGGSGFYLRSFFKAPTDEIPIGADVIDEVARIYEKTGLPGLLDALKRSGGEDLSGLDTLNPRRVMKALERVLGSGRGFQELRQLYESKTEPFPDMEKKVVMLSRSREDLQQRVRQRALAMLKAGLIGEVEALAGKGLRENPQTSGVIGYRETLRFLDGLINREELLEEIVKDTLQLVRKQRTFFKQLPVDKTLQLQGGAREDIQTLFD